MDVCKSYSALIKTIPGNVLLVAVSKFKPVESILNLHKETGHSVFGENRAQELALKYSQLPETISWHFIGHLQTNKIRTVIPAADLIQSVDSFRLLKEVNKEAGKMGIVQGVLLQLYIASEETKYGFSETEVFSMLNDQEFQKLGNIRLRGVMGMASFTENHQQVRKEFKSLRRTFEDLKRNNFASDDYFREVSMGMSGDYQIAIDEGSTIVRIGSLIFGER